MQNYDFVHSCIRVMDLEKSIEFYQDALNLKESSRKDFPEAEFTLVYLTDQNESFELELTTIMIEKNHIRLVTATATSQ